MYDASTLARAGRLRYHDGQRRGGGQRTSHAWSRGGGGGGGGGEKACHLCGETGHLKRDCPTRGGGGGAPAREPRRQKRAGAGQQPVARAPAQPQPEAPLLGVLSHGP